MRFERFFPNAQFEHWLNEQVARHLEAQAATFRPADRKDMGQLIHVEAAPAKEGMVRA
ncbi:conserved hypothetical protein [Bradyrhizobium sp. STM 3843]|uniref:hypothetical protein n=1 Tax=Bradyrhizobium sp. STM 3843 TaxID=551947 RepID=UPI000240365E|nr:hypothetical protein [Bradyrhizobium sp. STM 3843]CCE07771.1 conserved hypothetical protein [Bradyrhizobium sp. STM 3843]